MELSTVGNRRQETGMTRMNAHCITQAATVATLMIATQWPTAVAAQPGNTTTASGSATLTPPPPNTWAAELSQLAEWLKQGNHEANCLNHCYVLRNLSISGSLQEGPLSFAVEGGVLARGAVAVPLFGPPDQVRLTNIQGSGGTVQLGFDEGHYFIFTDARNFTVRGQLVLDRDLALTIPGPLNSLQADLTDGRLVEGADLSGLSGATVHFERGTEEEEATEPTVFQLARALRVGREITFEYRLVMRSGNDLGVVRLPLRHGEQVLDVQGAASHQTEGQTLVLPTAGRSAEMTITGTMPEVTTLAPDERSAYEWWLLESDPEHRVTAAGDARQFDVDQSPIGATQPNSRLYMVQRGQSLEVSVERLTGAEVLGAVVRHHHRRLVLTRQGDLVAQDDIDYENNGIDYLLYTPRGRPIYLATDNRSERIMHKGQDREQVMIPLRTGSHQVRTQALAETPIQLLGGVLELPWPEYPLTASRSTLSLGVPEEVYPVALVGGDRPWWCVGWGDAIALVLALIAAWLTVRRGRRWLLAWLVLAGLWFLSEAAFALVLALMVLLGGWWILSRLLSGAKLVLASIAVGAAILMVGFIGLVGFFAAGDRSAPEMATVDSWARQAAPSPSAPREQSNEALSRAPRASAGGGQRGEEGRLGNRYAQLAEGGVLQGVTPVPLPLPAAATFVTARRQLVTEDRPFQPTLFYVTTSALLPLVVAWLLALTFLTWGYRHDLVALKQRIAARLARDPGSTGTKSMPPSPQPTGKEATDRPSSPSAGPGQSC
jgi:hypothetical protein